MFELVVEFFFGGIDLFVGRDAINDELGLHIILGAVFLTAAEADPVHVDCAGIHALLGEGTNDAFEAHVHLMLDERFGHGEVVELDEFGDDLFALQVFLAVVALVLEAFADFGFEFVEGGSVADILGEFVVEVR